MSFAQRTSVPLRRTHSSGSFRRAVRRSPGAHGAFVEDSGVSGPDGTRVLRTDRERFNRCIAHIARGIHFHAFGERLERPTVVVSPNFFVSGADGRIATHALAEATVDVSRTYLQSTPALGENPAVFRYRVRLDGGLFAFCAQFYGHLEVYVASAPGMAADAA